VADGRDSAAGSIGRKRGNSPRAIGNRGGWESRHLTDLKLITPVAEAEEPAGIPPAAQTGPVCFSRHGWPATKGAAGRWNSGWFFSFGHGINELEIQVATLPSTAVSIAGAISSLFRRSLPAALSLPSATRRRPGAFQRVQREADGVVARAPPTSRGFARSTMSAPGEGTPIR